MTTGELIEKLREVDPGGMAPVTLGNEELYTVEHIPAYWDGCAQLHIVDEAAKPYWHIAGVKVTGRGSKVRLTAVGVEGFIADFPDGQVHLNELSESRRADWETRVERWRAQVKSWSPQVEPLPTPPEPREEQR